jgi:hypothetical protein
MVVASRGFGVTLLVYALLALYAGRRVSIRMVAIFSISMILLVPVVNNFRLDLIHVESGQGVGLADRIEVLASTFSETIQQPVGNAFDATTETFKSRQGVLLDITASALYLHPEHLPFVGEQLLEYFVNQLIPRFLNPFKFVGTPDVLQIRNIYMGAGPGLAAIGVFADSYRAGGWFFVIVWSVFFGVVGAWLYQQGPANNHFAGTVIYICLILHVWRYDGDMASTMLHLLQWGIPIWLVVTRIMFAPTRDRPLVKVDTPTSARQAVR